MLMVAFGRPEGARGVVRTRQPTGRMVHCAPMILMSSSILRGVTSHLSHGEVEEYRHYTTAIRQRNITLGCWYGGTGVYWWGN